MTPEEQIAELTTKLEAANKTTSDQAAQIEASKSSGNDMESMKAKMIAMEKTSADQLAENNKIKFEMAQKKAVEKYPYSAGMPGLIGKDDAEVEANAKIIHEGVASKTEAAVKAKEAEISAAWGKIPQGSPPGVLSQESLDAEKDRVSKITDPVQRIAAKMKLSLGSLGRKMQGTQ